MPNFFDMRKSKQLIISLLALSCSFLSLAYPDSEAYQCENLKVNYKISESAHESLYKLELTPTGGNAPYHYIFLDSKGNLLSHDQSVKECDKLGKGTYRCIVVDNQECKKELFIEIK